MEANPNGQLTLLLGKRSLQQQPKEGQFAEDGYCQGESRANTGLPWAREWLHKLVGLTCSFGVSDDKHPLVYGLPKLCCLRMRYLGESEILRKEENISQLS